MSATTSLDAESQAWVTALASAGSNRETAHRDLHALLLRIARAEVSRRGGYLRISGPELDDIAHQAAADALLAIITKVSQFRGESRFTTWAYKFVIFEVSSKVGRHFWRNPTVSLEGDEWERLPDRFGLDPAVERELTPHQRHIFVALVLEGVPLDALAIELDSNRNAIYKTMFDARRKLRLYLVANNYLTDNSARRT